MPVLSGRKVVFVMRNVEMNFVSNKKWIYMLLLKAQKVLTKEYPRLKNGLYLNYLIR